MGTSIEDADKIVWADIESAMSQFNNFVVFALVFIRIFPQVSTINVFGYRIWETIEALDEQDRLNGRDPPSLIKATEPDVVIPPEIEMLSKDGEDGNLTASAPMPAMPLGKALAINGVDVSTPDQHMLIRNLSLALDNGGSLLIVGPSGIGKSSLLRAVSGLWKVKCGSISLPPVSSMMFLPQNAYVPDIPLDANTLRAQVLFPRVDSDQSDDELLDALRKVNLMHLVGDAGVHTCQDWRKRLSNGEKQRLAMARLILAQPEICFLDEATSALDAKNEKLLYTTLRKQGSTYVSVGHKKELFQYHSHVLELMPAGAWRLKDTVKE